MPMADEIERGTSAPLHLRPSIVSFTVSFYALGLFLVQDDYETSERVQSVAVKAKIVEFLDTANRPFNANNLIDEMAPKCGVKKSVVTKALLVPKTSDNVCRI